MFDISAETLEAADGDARAGLITDQVFDQRVVGGTLDGDAFVTISDLMVS